MPPTRRTAPPAHLENPGNGQKTSRLGRHRSMAHSGGAGVTILPAAHKCVAAREPFAAGPVGQSGNPKPRRRRCSRWTNAEP